MLTWENPEGVTEFKKWLTDNFPGGEHLSSTLDQGLYYKLISFSSADTETELYKLVTAAWVGHAHCSWYYDTSYPDELTSYIVPERVAEFCHYHAVQESKSFTSGGEGSFRFDTEEDIVVSASAVPTQEDIIYGLLLAMFAEASLSIQLETLVERAEQLAALPNGWQSWNDTLSMWATTNDGDMNGALELLDAFVYAIA